MDHREIMMKRIKDMILRLKDEYKMEEVYIKAIHNKKYDKCSVYVKDLGLTQCWASNKGKITNPVYVKVSVCIVFNII